MQVYSRCFIRPRQQPSYVYKLLVMKLPQFISICMDNTKASHASKEYIMLSFPPE